VSRDVERDDITVVTERYVWLLQRLLKGPEKCQNLSLVSAMEIAGEKDYSVFHLDYFIYIIY